MRITTPNSIRHIRAKFPDVRRGSVAVVGEDIIRASAAFLPDLHMAVPEVKVVCIGDELDAEKICALLLLDIDGFLRYDEAERRLCTAVRSVANGDLFAEPKVLQKFVRFARRVMRPRTMDSSCTPRQQQIVDLLRNNLSNKQIANSLGISLSTVKFHVSKILKKSGVHERTQICDSGVALGDQIFDKRLGPSVGPGTLRGMSVAASH